MAEHKKPHVWFTMSGVLAATAFPSAEDPERMEKPPRNNPDGFQPQKKGAEHEIAVRQ